LKHRPPKFQFYCDENFPAPAGKFLKSRGHTVYFARDYLKIGSHDVSQLIFATKHELTFITIDHDFKSYSFPPTRIHDSYGVIILETDIRTEARYKQILIKLLQSTTPNQVRGRICRLSIDKIDIINPIL
jgi:predicted nuclease of predicted toxin-antitoxin system